ncbi:MAG TPA: V-type ATP synthase subunit E [Candidatus Cloacimonadota bacterium]|nr:V-type ATP synthase subunit E [Candidatus Cloacimonadota bacterium]HPS38750.1 V-type ATP synthase subunit E [Candidatus Cloacimonadota bacterium]
MNDQLQELLTRVYDEGVAKAKAEADRILSEAKAQAEAILSDANQKAQASVSDANHKAEELQKNSNSDIKLAAQHSISSLKNKVTDLILESVFDQNVKSAFEDAEFIKKMIMEVLEGWKKDHADGNIVLSDSLQKKLDESYITSMKAVLNNKLTVDFSPVMKDGFTISPANGTYKLSFTDEDFTNLFKSFLRARTQKLLFES